jgi:hypothetical protein
MIFPRSTFQSESRLFASLAQLYPVDFSPEGENGFDRVDAAIFFSQEVALAERAFERGVSAFVFNKVANGMPLATSTTVGFSEHAVLHAAFRGARIPAGEAIKAACLRPADQDSVLASHGSQNLWSFRSSDRAEVHTVATEPPSLQGERMLWHYLRPDGWLALLPFLHFLRRVTAPVDWSPPPRRACFIFDDPNLHSARYGYIDYAHIADHARAHNYHVAIATIPLDAWYAGEKAVEIFLRHRERLSLLIHGNDHVKNELGYDYSDRDAQRMLAQALRRVGGLERRTGLRVGRVIAPPHGGCSNSVLAQASRLPIEGVCTSAESLARCHNLTSLPLDFGLLPAWFGPGSCPVVCRWDLFYGLMPLRLAAFLGQPVIPYGHHRDCAEGFGPLAEIVSVVNSWGPATWTNLETILRGNYRTIRDGELMHVQMCSRDLYVPIPEDVSHVLVHGPAGAETVQWKLLTASSEGETGECTPGVPFRVGGSEALRLRIPWREVVDPTTVGRPAYRLWAPIRRALTMGRDRLTPVLHRGGGTCASFAAPHNA